jgi:hypothetical protein
MISPKPKRLANLRSSKLKYLKNRIDKAHRDENYELYMKYLSKIKKLEPNYQAFPVVIKEGKFYTSVSMIKQEFKELHGYELPISGGYGTSENEPIFINETDPARSAYWIGQVVFFVEDVDPEAKKVEYAGNTIMHINDRDIEKYTISITFKSRLEDKTFHYDKDYYFDITKMLRRIKLK